MTPNTDLTEPQNELISQAEAARRWGVSREMVRLYSKRGGMPMSGKRILWPAAEEWRKLNVVRDRSKNPKTRSGEQAKPLAVAPAIVPPVAPAAAGKPVAETMADASARKESAIADLRELELGQKRGELLSKVDVELGWAQMIVAVRSRLLQMPGKLAPRVAHADIFEAQEAIREEVYAALNELAFPEQKKRKNASQKKVN